MILFVAGSNIAAALASRNFTVPAAGRHFRLGRHVCSRHFAGIPGIFLFFIEVSKFLGYRYGILWLVGIHAEVNPGSCNSSNTQAHPKPD